MDRVALLLMLLMGLCCSRAPADHRRVGGVRPDASPSIQSGETDATPTPNNNVEAGASEASGAGASIPLRWVGSWHAVYGRSAFSGMSLCMVIEENGHFDAEEREIEFKPSSKPCGGHYHCKIPGQMTPEGSQVRFTYETSSCGLRLPRSNVGAVSIVGKVLSFRFDRGGLFGSLESFGMIAGACPKQPAACP